MEGPQFVVAMLAIIGIFFVTIPVLIGSITKLQREKMRMQGSTGTGEGLGLSELQRMIEEAVIKAASPMQDQMDRLEDRLERIERRQDARVNVPAADEYVQPTSNPEKTAGRIRS